MCNHPEVPIYDGRAVPSSAPARCATCGGELALVCTGKGCDAPLGENNRVRGRGISRTGTRTFKPKPCARCLRTFQPRGPHSLYCGREDCAAIQSDQPEPEVSR